MVATSLHTDVLLDSEECALRASEVAKGLQKYRVD